MESLLLYLRSAQDILMAIAFVISVYVYIQKKERAHLYLMLLLGLLVAQHLVIYCGVPLFSKNAVQLWNFINGQLLPIELGGYILVYIALFTDDKKKRIGFSFLIILFIAICIDIFTINELRQTFNTRVYHIAAAFAIISIFIYLHQLFQRTETQNIFSNFWFWISVGLFVFLTTEIPVMSLINYVIENYREEYVVSFYNLWTVKLITGILYYLMYPVALYKCSLKN